MSKDWSRKNTIAIVLFCITNILVSIAALFTGRNVLLAEYAASPYDVFIENVLDTDIGQLLVGIGSTIIMLAMLVFAIAIFGYIRFRKSQYDKELLMFHTIICLLTAFTVVKLIGLTFLVSQIDCHPAYFVSTIYYCVTATGVFVLLARTIHLGNMEI